MTAPSAAQPGSWVTKAASEPGRQRTPPAGPDCDAQAASVASTLELIGQGRHKDGARLFMETVAFGPGAWDQLPEPVRDTFMFNAPVFRDEQADPDWSASSLPNSRLPARRCS
jgi:hypothetical protein